MKIRNQALIVTLALSAIAQSQNTTTNSYTAKSLVSDISGVAPSTDTHLVNPWGLSKLASPTLSENEWWASDNGTGVSTLYDGSGTVVSGLVVTIPPASGTGAGSPTGTVGVGSNFAFATADGTISFWNSTTGNVAAGFVHSQQATTGCTECHTSAAKLKVNNSSKGASYSGLTVASNSIVNSGKATLYAANTNGGIEAYDASSFTPVTLPPGAFVDPNVPSNLMPCGIQAIGSTIYVTFAPTGSATGGAVDAFNAAGALQLRLESGSWFSQPFGVAKAPSNFGAFSGALLVGNTLNGTIMAFNPTTGNFVGLLHNSSGKAISAPGLWGISFGNGSTDSGPTNVLYFNAGVANYNHGVFGSITSND
jgi:uncharacterized protein (TIGR03118 family)